MTEPLVFDEPKSKMLTPIHCFEIDEVRKAAENHSSLSIPIAVIAGSRTEGFRQEVHMMELFDIALIDENPKGFLFSGRCQQLITTVLHEHEIETTYELMGRSSICQVDVTDRQITLTFSTTVMINQVTGVFGTNY